MVSKELVLARQTARRSKPAPALSMEQRIASALLARDYGSTPAPDGVPADVWARDCAELRRFDGESAQHYLVCHDQFVKLYRGAYGRAYPRTVHNDWRVMRDLVREHGPEYAFVVIDRAFDEPALVEAGIESVEIVSLWAHVVLRRGHGPFCGGRQRPRGRLKRDELSWLRVVVSEHAGIAGGVA